MSNINAVCSKRSGNKYSLAEVTIKGRYLDKWKTNLIYTPNETEMYFTES